MTMRYGHATLNRRLQPVLWIGSTAHSTKALVLAAIAMRAERDRCYEARNLAGAADLRQRIDAARAAVAHIEAQS
jgi:hypothetical protein